MSEQLEAQILSWREYVNQRDTISAADADELESHLREQIDSLADAGLSHDEAFLVAVKRLGALSVISNEYAREHSERLWKQLTLDENDAPGHGHRGAWTAVAFALAAAVLVKLPALFGLSISGGDENFYAQNLTVLTLLVPTVFFLVRRHAVTRTWLAALAPFVLIALVINLFPFDVSGMTLPLAIAHSGIVGWLALGIAYVNGEWASGRARMNFIRFTGEWLVYFVLLALGGGVLTGLTVSVFASIGMLPGVLALVAEWIIPCGAAGAVVIAALLVESKQSVIENIAPVLTRVFTPLMTALLLVLVTAGFVQGNFVESGRELLILFDLVLLVVLGLLLYSQSARVADAPASWFDRLQLLMIGAALVVDTFVLIAMFSRIGEYGASANKLASLGVNVILLVNLLVAAWRQWSFVRHRISFARVESWQTSYVPVYLIWAAIVLAVFPPVFRFA